MDKVIAEIFSSGLNSPPPHGSCTMFYEINIYQSGKIEISTYSNDRWGNTPKSIFLKIDDNIPIPEYIIDMFKMIFNSGETYNHHIMYYIKVLQKFKEDYAADMYKTNNYGYLSSISNTMKNHLKKYNEEILEKINLNDGDIVIDIGSNDGTFLHFYNKKKNSR